jgi:hypothetical protein
LYPHEHELDVRSFVTSELKPLCHEGKIIYDHVGQGAQKIM